MRHRGYANVCYDCEFSMTLTVETLAALLRTHPMFAPIYDDTASPTQREMDEHDSNQRRQRADDLAAWLLPQLGAGAPAGPWENCHDCGARMMWSDPDASAPSWMCPRCVYYRMVRAESDCKRVGATERVERSADAPEGPWRPTGEETHERT